jgi:hypothetical protein
MPPSSISIMENVFLVRYIYHKMFLFLVRYIDHNKKVLKLYNSITSPY